MKKTKVVNKISQITVILLVTSLAVVCSFAGCKSEKNNKNINETMSEDINGDISSEEGRMFAVSNTWYTYNVVGKTVTEVYKKDGLVNNLIVKNEYDSDGYRIKKTAGDTITTFKYDKEHKLIKEVSISNGSGTHTLNYTYDLTYYDVKGPKYTLTGFTYNEKTYTFGRDFVGSINSIYEGDNCIAEYEKYGDITVYEVKNGEKIKNDSADFVGNLNGVLDDYSYFYYDYDSEMYFSKALTWTSRVGDMNYVSILGITEKNENADVTWVSSKGYQYVYGDNKKIEKVVSGSKTIAEYSYFDGYNSFVYIKQKATDNKLVKYEYFSENEDIAQGKYFLSDLFAAWNDDFKNDEKSFYNEIQSSFGGKLKSVSTVINGKEHILTYKYGYETDAAFSVRMSQLQVSGFSYNGRTYKFEFADYDSYLITGIIDDKGNKIVSYKIENDGDIYYNRKTYEIKDGVEIENSSPDFIGNLNLVILDGMIYDEECGVNFEAINCKK